MEPVWVTPPPDSAAPQPVPPGPAAPVPFWRALKFNLLSGMRLFFGRRSNEPGFVSTFDQLATLLIFSIVVGILLDWQRSESGAELQLYDAVYAWGLWIGLICLIGALLARSLSAAADTRKVLVIATSVAPWALVLLWAMSWTAQLGVSDDFLSVLRIAVFIWVGLQLARGANGRIPPLTVVVVLLGSLVLGRMDRYFYMDTHAWQLASSDNEEEASLDRDWESTESLFFNEPDRIAEAVDALEAERPGISDVYYVGFAGDGSQSVFEHEALFGEEVFAKRLGSGSRSVELINNVDDRIAHPIASMSGLRDALVRVGERMNKDEDVLVLLLTSHGTREGTLAVSNGSLPLNDIAPEHLRRALDASGIQWRVIVVSACFAGTFIEPLQSDKSLVITAADADHTSFGCADDRDLTYFGEAFLRDALPKAGSLPEAFQLARKAIRAREREEKLTPSNPQMYLGEAMRAKLATFDGNTPHSGTP